MKMVVFFFLSDNSMVMTMVTNMNMNMVLPAVGRSLNHNQTMSNILYLLCSLRNDKNYNPGNIFLERMK